MMLLLSAINRRCYLLENHIFTYRILMKNIKDEPQHIIPGDGSAGQTDDLKKTQAFLRANATASFSIKKQQLLKSEEEATLTEFASSEGLFYKGEISEEAFISVMLFLL
jgi:hypothetical protein